MRYRVDCCFPVSGTVSGSVSYPASQNGGSTSATFSYHHDVYVRIHVDGDPVEQSVDYCNGSVAALTGSLIGMKGAYIGAKYANAKRVAGTLSKGFMSLIRQEIAQQMAQIGARIPTMTAEIRVNGDFLRSKHTQMQEDFERISGRYAVTFSKLDEDMRTSIYHLDREALDLHATIGRLIGSTYEESGCGTAVSVGEQGTAVAGLVISGAKTTTTTVVDGVQDFIGKAHVLEKDIQDYLSRESVETAQMLYYPVLFSTFESLPDTAYDSRRSGRLVELPPRLEQSRRLFDAVPTDEVAEPFRSMSPAVREGIGTQFKRRVSGFVLANPSPETQRLAATMMQLWSVQK